MSMSIEKRLQAIREQALGLLPLSIVAESQHGDKELAERMRDVANSIFALMNCEDEE